MRISDWSSDVCSSDLTVAASSPRPFVVGFAAETHELEHYARDKLQRKGLDLIAANQVGCAGAGFEADCNTLPVFWADGTQIGRSSFRERACQYGYISAVVVS